MRSSENSTAKPDNSMALSYQRRQEKRQLELARKEIDRRASKREQQELQSSATFEISPFNSFYIRHAKALTFCSLEMFHNTFFHFIETIKVRGMARNLKDDVSHYFSNKV